MWGVARWLGIAAGIMSGLMLIWQLAVVGVVAPLSAMLGLYASFVDALLGWVDAPLSILFDWIEAKFKVSVSLIENWKHFLVVNGVLAASILRAASAVNRIPERPFPTTLFAFFACVIVVGSLIERSNSFEQYLILGFYVLYVIMSGALWFKAFDRPSEFRKSDAVFARTSLVELLAIPAGVVVFLGMNAGLKYAGIG